MKKHIIAFVSATYANKAKSMLNRYGINTSVVRTPKTIAGGCGYSVIAAAGAETITSLLEKNSIPYKSISEYKQ